MTNEELRLEIAKLSPKIATLLARQIGSRISAELGSLAQTFTRTPDFASAVTVFKEDPAKLTAFEDVVATAARVASPSPNLGSPTAAYRWVIPIISGIILLGFFTLLGLLLRGNANWNNIGDIKSVLFTLLGALGAAFTQVVNYWLGSSKGSADKTNLLASQSGS